MKKKLFKVLKVLTISYVMVCALLFFFQEKLIFFPQKLDKAYKFSFDQEFREISVNTEDQKKLHGLLFKTQNSKGLIFYLHGNAGSVASWGGVAKTYTDLNYGVFMLDYRGFGKSEGSISSQEQIFQDMQSAYSQMLNEYDENEIIVLGYSIGTGLAAKIASTNNPKLLILQAPYYSLIDMMKHTYPIIPTFILKYKFETNKYIKDCKMPIVIFHGNQDKVIYYNSSVKLKSIMKSTDRLITLDGQGHNGMTNNPDYSVEIEKILN
ncbi:alpha/beta fold hydrolase [Fulvivirgaceae bacterium BMA10]|uniref:Alpha/beta fold hydrolase n=1 Tax=Splendidivirga corallicola TaxID=3051826 RepID=A0ABT8KPQ0_9BACT|nr:alpha/beta fold hydrolase [Fulvivirgaceae bacterium BMA10]